MKRPKTIIAIIVCALIVTYLVAVPIKRIRQNNASVAMLRLQHDLMDHVRNHGTWPQSWDNLYPEMVNRKIESSRAAIVNWNITIDEMLQYVEQYGHDRHITRESEVLFIVRYTDRVPRDRSSEFNEKVWNDLIAQNIHVVWMARQRDDD